MKPKLTRDERDMESLIEKLWTDFYAKGLGSNDEMVKAIELRKLINTIKFPSSTHLAEKKRYVDNLLKAFLIGIK